MANEELKQVIKLDDLNAQLAGVERAKEIIKAGQRMGFDMGDRLTKANATETKLRRIKDELYPGE